MMELQSATDEHVLLPAFHAEQNSPHDSKCAPPLTVYGHLGLGSGRYLKVRKVVRYLDSHRNAPLLSKGGDLIKVDELPSGTG